MVQHALGRWLSAKRSMLVAGGLWPVVKKMPIAGYAGAKS